MNGMQNRIRMMLGRAIVRLTDDARLVQEMQIDLLADESQDAVERLQDYGFTSHPHPGAEAVVGCIGGLRSHAVVLAVGDRRYRLKGLEAGEVAIHDDLGNVVKLGRTALEITAASQIVMTAPDGVAITGDVTVTGDVKADGISLKTHHHTGVQPGGGNSGGPA